MNYVERHFGDWARDTAHLSMLEDGAYNRLCDLYYVREVPLPSDLAACCRLVRAVSKPEREAVRTVLQEFFIATDEGWRHKRCDTEIERFRAKSGKAAASARARWNKDASHSDGNANAHANASPDAMRTHSEGNATRERGRARSHSPLPNTQEEKPPKPPEGVGRFPEFWAVWPKSPRKGGKPECLRLWQSKGLEREADTVLAHVRAMASTEGWTKAGGDFVPAPAVYLRGRRWDGAELVNGSEHADQPWAGAL